MMKRAKGSEKMLGKWILALGFFATAQVGYAEKFIVSFESKDRMSESTNRLMGAYQKRFSVKSNLKVEKVLPQIGVVIVEADKNLKQVEKDFQGAIVEKNFRFPAPKDVKLSQPRDARASDFVRMDFMPDLGQPRMPWGISAVRAEEAWNMGYKGEGVKVMVVDSGIDRDHPDLMSNFVWGEDFFGDNRMDVPYSYFDTVGHGTHVAGTILANGEGGGVLGVAPSAELYVARVCNEDYCDGAALFSAIEFSVSSGMDVVNLSLGGGPPSSLFARAYERAAKAGVIVVAASGNNGEGFVSFPAAYAHTIAVGAIDQNLQKAEFSQYGEKLDVVAPGVDVESTVPRGSALLPKTEIEQAESSRPLLTFPVLGTAVPIEAIQAELVSVGLGREGDYSAETQVAGKIALIQRGEITFTEKVQRAEDYGAAGVLIWNNDGPARGGFGLQDDVSIPVFMISQRDGEDLREALEIGLPTLARLSAVPHDYDFFPGTSMAAPHVSGVVALMKQANPMLTFEQAREAIKSTATRLSGNQSHFGSGLVNAPEAVSAAMSHVQMAKATGF